MYVNEFILYFIFITIEAKPELNGPNEIDPVVYSYQEFPYKETAKNEQLWREWELACEQNSECETLFGIERRNCVRQCIAPSCYLDIYSHDQLEEGEIDVRINSFKGCFIQRVAKPKAASSTTT